MEQFANREECLVERGLERHAGMAVGREYKAREVRRVLGLDN